MLAEASVYCMPEDVAELVDNPLVNNMKLLLQEQFHWKILLCGPHTIKLTKCGSAHWCTHLFFIVMKSFLGTICYLNVLIILMFYQKNICLNVILF